MKIITNEKIYLAILMSVFLLNFGTAFAQYSSYQIASYKYNQFSTSGESSIDLYDSRNKLKGILIFLPIEVGQLPIDSQDSRGLVRLYYPVNSLQNVVDLLRNESPIVLKYWHGVEDNSHIGTYKRELVGESE